MKSIKCHSAVLMIKDIFTKVVLKAMRMDIMTYKTEIKKKPQRHATYKCHKYCLFHVSKALLQLDDFQNILQQSIHSFQTI